MTNERGDRIQKEKLKGLAYLSWAGKWDKTELAPVPGACVGDLGMQSSRSSPERTGPAPGVLPSLELLVEEALPFLPGPYWVPTLCLLF